MNFECSSERTRHERLESPPALGVQSRDYFLLMGKSQQGSGLKSKIALYQKLYVVTCLL